MEVRKLNALRGLAAFIVFITHFSDITNWLDGMLGGGSGAYGVMLFFLLSGFLMSYLYLSQEFNKINVKRYLLARAARVAPLFFVVVLSSYILSLAGNDTLYSIPDVNTLIGHLLFLYGESVLWSIPPEIQFYFVFIIFWSFSKSRPGYIYFSIIAVMILLFFMNFPRINGDLSGIPYNLFNTLRSLPYFFIGVIFGMHFKSIKIPSYLRKHWFILVLLLIPAMYPELTSITSDAKHRMWLSYEVLLVMSSVFFCIVFLVPDNNVLLANRFGDFLGKISYSLYLLHMPIIIFVNKLNLSVELKLILSFGLTVSIAFVSFKYFEKPVASFIRNIASNKNFKRDC
ncbi:acyltransferase [Colwellia sp. 75C3]|uniref:acyltransferase family protein n=1 Tax=Colwellia sp. 75C3 TaxID=888425 RepID=UPI000C32D2B2|nr:acyltransferase [Colwellia sp. 75C3]PKG80621.1 acyltransferase [Colwellia sp. 75C3]